MQLEEEEEPWWGSKWEDGKGEFVSGSLAVWGRGTSSLCRAGVLEICAEAAARQRPPRIQTQILVQEPLQDRIKQIEFTVGHRLQA